VYVWQRAWSAHVRAAVEQGRETMQTFVVFAGEVSLGGAKPRLVRPAIDYAALKATGRPIGLAVRVDPFAGPFRADDANIDAIVDFARECLGGARRNGVEPAELQIDFDCAEVKLAGYRVWLKTLRTAVQPLPVCPTVLPSWLKRAEFTALARESGRFVLQVHSVAPPRKIADTEKLTDPARAAEWVEQAGRIGVPFRVALPTYAYLVAFDAEGKPRGVSAEAPSSHWPADARVVRWEADPDDLAQLIVRWTQSRPAAMTGVIWYRLPVASDALNWRWPTLAAVLQGRAPTRHLRVIASDAQPSEIVVRNDGERDEPLPAIIDASWDGAPLVAADALAGYTCELGANRIRFRRTAAAELSRLPPGAQRPIGWLRCEHPTPIRVIAVEMSANSHAQPALPRGDGL
jgi:hypothetical protein